MAGLRALTVVVDYTDIFALTYAYNKHHFSEFGVVTSHADTKTRDFCYRNNLWCYVTDDFYKNGASFNKWLALENGLDAFGRHGWLCLLDADVLWPKDLCVEENSGAILLHQKEFEGTLLTKRMLCSPLRRMFDNVQSLMCGCCKGRGKHETSTEKNVVWHTFNPCIECSGLGYIFPPEKEWRQYPIHRNVAEWAGYSQIFHAEDPVLGPPPWHQVDWKHAGGADSFFQQKWHPSNKVRPPFHILHLGLAGQNWMGRATKYLDGTTPENSVEKINAIDRLWKERRRRRNVGQDQFGEEKL